MNRLNQPADSDKEAQLDQFKKFSDEQARKGGGPRHAVLDESGNVVPATLFEWAFWLEKAGDRHRVIQQDYPGEYKVSTVFIGLELGWNPERPLWFETMVFGPEEETEWFDGTKKMMRKSLWTGRCATLAQAKAQHEEGHKWLAAHLAEKSAP